MPEIRVRQEDCLRGIELEGWGVDANGGLCDMEHLVERFKEVFSSAPLPTGTFTTEPGYSSFELVGNPADTVEVAVRNILCLHEMLEGANVHPSYCNQRPKGVVPQGKELPTSRYIALWEATKHEARANGYTDHLWKTLHLMKERAALQVTFSVPGLNITDSVFSPELLFVMNVLNFVGPRVSKLQLTRCGIFDSNHLSIWHGWASPERFTHGMRWHRDFDQLRRHFEGLSRLLKCIEHHPLDSKRYGKWDVDLKTPHEWGSLDDEQGGWWPYVRPRIKFAPGALEVRLHPSISFEHLATVVNELDEFFRLLVSIAPSQSLGYDELKKSPQWKLITSHCMGGGYIPFDYTQDMRDRDIKGLAYAEAA